MKRVGGTDSTPHGDDTHTPNARPPRGPAPPKASPRNMPGALQPLDAGPAHGASSRLPRRARTLDLSDPLIETPYDRYALELIIYESQFNGSRPHERLLSQFMPSSLRGHAPFWDLDEQTIAGKRGSLVPYGDVSGSPFEATDGKYRIRLHYADTTNVERMTQQFGPPTGKDPAFMRNSYRTVLIRTESGWQQIKFSIPDNARWEFNAPNKFLPPAEIEAAVQYSKALQGNPIYAQEPAGIALNLDDGHAPITQLWRKMPVASRGFEPGDFAASIHVITDPAFARSERGQAIFSAYMEKNVSIEEAQASWLVGELAPRLGNIIMDSLSSTHIYPQLHEQNVEVVIDRSGRILDVFVKDLTDIALDYRAIAAAGEIDRWRHAQANAMGYASPIANDLQFPNLKRYTVQQHFRAFFGSIGAGPMLAHELSLPPSAIVEETTRILSERVRQWLPEAWLHAHRGKEAYEGAFGARATTPYERISNLRELIIEYLEDNKGATELNDDPR